MVRMVPPTKITSAARLLIVDDDTDCAFGLARMLKRTGYTACTVVTSSKVAAERLPELKPDLILLDLHMHPVSGIDLLQQLKKMSEPCLPPPVIMLTADTTAEAKYEALAAGASAFLAKPLDLIEVILRVENLLTTRDLYQRCQLYSAGLERLLDKRTAELHTADLEKELAGLRDAQQHVIQQERMRALSTMAAGVAHDLNNGLFIIVGHGDMLLTDSKTFPPDSAVRASLEKMVLAGHDSAELVKRLREFHRPADPVENREPIDLNQLIDEAVALTAPRWQSQKEAGNGAIRIKKNLGKISLISGVPAELREVLTNLIFNSVEAMPDGGVLSFRTKGKRSRVRLEISDTGGGMTEETLHKCFEPFFSTKGAEGSGLGLAMSHGIVRRHDGTITVQSRLKKGTTVTISFPVLKQQISPAVIESKGQAGEPGPVGFGNRVALS